MDHVPTVFGLKRPPGPIGMFTKFKGAVMGTAYEATTLVGLVTSTLALRPESAAQLKYARSSPPIGMAWASRPALYGTGPAIAGAMLVPRAVAKPASDSPRATARRAGVRVR